MPTDLPTSPQKKYWAFVSYSSKDRKWGKWLHNRLENYPIPKEFQGTRLFDGAVLGKDLKPCFRDRDELSGSADLGPAIFKALNQSRYLIVLCSKNSAKSEWVNKEIEDFKSIGGERKILALILDGEPNASSNEKFDDSEECFPPALRYPVEPLAGDMRKEGDGKERGFLKVLSGIAQLDFDMLYRRHERAQRKKRLVLGSAAVAVISMLTLLSIVAISQKGIADTQKARAEEQTKKVEEAKVKQDSLLLEASMGDHEAATRAFEEGKYNEGLAYLARAIRLKPDNEAPKIMAANYLFGPAAPKHITRWVDNFGYMISEVTFSQDGRYVAIASGKSLKVKEAATARQVSSVSFADYVTSVAFSPDGRWITSGSLDSTARVHDVITGKQISLSRFGDSVTSVAFSPDGRWIAAGSLDGTARVFEAGTGNQVSNLEFEEEVFSVEFSPDNQWIAAGSADGTARVFKTANGEQLSSLEFGGGVYSLAFSPDGRWIVAGGEDKTARVFEAETGITIYSLEFDGWVNSVAFSPDGRRIAIGSGDKTARVFEAATGSQTFASEFGDEVISVVFSPDGWWIALVSGNHVRIVEAANGRQVSSLEFGKAVSSVAFSPDGRWIGAGGADNTARVFESATGNLANSLEFDAGSTFVKLSPDGRTVATNPGEKTVHVIDVATGERVSVLEFAEEVISVRFSPNCRWIAAISVGGIEIVEVATGKPISFAKLEKMSVTSVLFSPDGRRIAGSCRDRSIRRENFVKVFDVETGKQVSTLSIGKRITSMAYSPDGRWIAVGSEDKTARVFELSNGTVVTVLEFSGIVDSVAFSPNGRWIAAGSWDGSVRVFDLAIGELVSSADFEEGVTSLSFSPDGRWLVSSCKDDNVRIVEAATGYHATQSVFGEQLTCVAYSPDGCWIAGATWNDAIRIIESRSGKQVSSLQFGSRVTSMTFSPDGRWLTVQSGDQKAGVIDTNWWNESRLPLVRWPGILENASNLFYDASGKLVSNPISSSALSAEIFSTESSEDVKEAHRFLFDWISAPPDARMLSPWSQTHFREHIGNMMLRIQATGNQSEMMVSMAAEQAPWHPLVPVSLAGAEKVTTSRIFLAELSLKRLREADVELWGEETLALYFAKSAEWMDGMELGQVALDTAEEALKWNPDDAGVMKTLENIKARME